ncbi:MAG: hypothetical protein AB7L09_02700 [Nitrospira sp.]
MRTCSPRIRIYWSNREKDLIANCEDGTSKSTARYIFGAVLPPEVLSELDKRGYDVESIRFQIRRKPLGVLDQMAEIE